MLCVQMKGDFHVSSKRPNWLIRHKIGDFIYQWCFILRNTHNVYACGIYYSVSKTAQDSSVILDGLSFFVRNTFKDGLIHDCEITSRRKAQWLRSADNWSDIDMAKMVGGPTCPNIGCKGLQFTSATWLYVNALSSLWPR